MKLGRYQFVCAECGEMSWAPALRGRRRRYCSRKCINQRALRRGREIRQAHPAVSPAPPRRAGLITSQRWSGG